MILKLAVKAMFIVIKNDEAQEKMQGISKAFHILIYGAGELGRITKTSIEADSKGLVTVVGFIDDNPSFQGKSLGGVPVFSKQTALNIIVRSYAVQEIVVSINNIDSHTKSELIAECLERGVKVKSVPPVNTWINGQLSQKQIKDVSIEDLLQRDEIKLNDANISENIKDNSVLITGAAGSIGSEIARQVMKYLPNTLILIDQAESPLYHLYLDIMQKHNRVETRVRFHVADINDRKRMEDIFVKEKPDILFHAAAYKHVPLMESNAYEALNVNTVGTKLLADLSIKHKVNRFVYVSTDKAVNPTNIMGASKRLGEIYIQSLENRNDHDTIFITTRFGNVLGSNGSVIPVFEKQIAEGGPITVTDPEVTRYFMTIQEACQLVLEAGAMGKGGEIFIFDMGKSVKIIDLAKKMIQLSGLELGRDIQIKIVGLRPGEKLYEELLADEETTKQTHHNKIRIAKVREHQFAELITFYENLEDKLFAEKFNLREIRKYISKLVPEYTNGNGVEGTMKVLERKEP